jgi:hypothetical protein
MFCEYFHPFLFTSLNQIPCSCRCPERWSDNLRSLGEPVFYYKLASLLNFMHKAYTHTCHIITVRLSVDASVLELD